MSEPFLGELRLFPYNFAPRGWAFCQGQILSIAQNTALFSLLGTTYGGNGQTTFALPDLRGRVPIHMGAGHTQGEKGGQENHTLSIQEMPAHIHFFMASASNANQAEPGVLASTANFYRPDDGGNYTTLHPGSITNAGGNQPHNNMQPYLVMTWFIAVIGIFPSQN
jgi:microcystin-dependent protein